MSPDAWIVELHQASVASLHSLGIPETPHRTLRICTPTDRALVLGRAQPETDVDPDALRREDLQLIRRQSGGGAVLVEPGDLVWFDVLIPAGDPLWHDDVGTAFYWLGDLLADVLGGNMHRGALVANEWSRTVCFASLGPGEVTKNGKKIAGISQRRTRQGAWFQCSIPRRFDSRRIASLLRLDADRRRTLISYLDAHVGTMPAFDVDTVINHLP